MSHMFVTTSVGATPPIPVRPCLTDEGELQYSHRRNLVAFRQQVRAQQMLIR